MERVAEKVEDLSTEKFPKESLLIQFVKENWFLIFITLYILLPVDLIPDSIPLIGSVDDSVLLLIKVLQMFKEFRDARNSASTHLDKSK